MAKRSVSATQPSAEPIFPPEEFESNREQTLERMGKEHSGRWIALSADGKRVAESHRSLARLVDELRAKGTDLAEVSLEKLEKTEAGDVSTGGADLL